MEIFTAYTELDPNSKIAVSTRRITFTGIERNVFAHVYRDKGLNYFDGNFVHLLTINISAHTDQVEVISPWVMANNIEGLFDLENNNRDALKVYLYHPSGQLRLRVYESDGGTPHLSPSPGYAITLGTTYYLKIVRDESVGTFGTLYCYVYSDSGRTSLLSTLSVALNTSKKDFRYIFALNTLTAGPGGYTATGYIENLELIILSLSITTEAVTDITTTTATGNGTLVDLGIATVTAHGHCWATTIDPTTGDNVVDNGEGSLGAFTSSMGSLSAGQKYWVRAYATSTEGTVYGANVTFTAGYTSTQLIAGNLAIVQGHLQYIDASGVEKYIPGIPA